MSIENLSKVKQTADSSNSAEYFCTACKQRGNRSNFALLSELRQHILRTHFGKSDNTFENSADHGSTVRNIELSEANGGINNDDRDNERRRNRLLVVEESDLNARSNVDRGADDFLEYLKSQKYPAQPLGIEEIFKEKIREKEMELELANINISDLIRKNDLMVRNLGRIESQNQEIITEMEKLKRDLKDKDILLQDKERVIFDQSKIIKDAKEKEALVKLQLEKSFEKLLERAQLAEQNLEIYKQKLMDSKKALENEEISQIIDSCQFASSNALIQTKSNKVEDLTRLIQSNTTGQLTTPLAEIYLKNFMDRYQQLKAAEYVQKQKMSNRRLPSEPSIKVPKTLISTTQ